MVFKGTIKTQEWIWLLVVSTLVMLLSSIPYMVGYLQENEHYVFGGSILNRPDYNVYIANIQGGLRGMVSYPMLHSPETVNPVYLRPFYVWVGWLGRWTSFSAPELYQLARWLCGSVALLVMYVFAAYFFTTASLRRYAWLLFVFGSGVGWLLVIFNTLPASGNAPADFAQIELYGFLTILLTPHFALTEALQWGMALAFLRGWEDGPHWWQWLALGLGCAVLAQTIQLFAPFTVDVALGLYEAWGTVRERRINWRRVISLIVLALLQLPWVGYATWVFQFDPFWRSYYAQNLVLAPPLLEHVLGLGGMGVLLILGLGRIIKLRSEERWLFLALWVVVIAVATYWPSQLQRRFVAGGMAPVAVIATVGALHGVWGGIRRYSGYKKFETHQRRFWRAQVLGLLLLFVAQSTLWLTGGITASMLGRHPIYFDAANERQAMLWLQTHAAWQEPVFSSDWTGNIIPAVIGQRVYIGHWAESTNYWAKKPQVERFFQPTTSDADRYHILSECACRYVFYGQHERKLGLIDLKQSDFLQLVYENATVQIYTVKLSQNPGTSWK